MKLYHQEYGEGFPLVVLHGLFGSSDNWHSLAQRFGSFFHVFCLDLRNHGRSPWDKHHSYEAMAEDVHDFFHQQGIRKAHLLGHSMGGKVGMHFAQRYPHLLDKMVVADMGIKSYTMHHQAILMAIRALDLSKIRSRGEAAPLIARYIPEVEIQQFILKNLYWVEKGRLAWRMNTAVLEREMPNMLSALPRNESGTQTLFLRGALSNYILAEDEASIEELFPDSMIQTISNAGHWLHAEQPDAFFEAVMGFFLR
ncbi:MAG: alpha/beta fold hydrolase [Bacteroidetes bacterium]|nr:alpha/beta fold hydrolase [Bacteroidota bacterium]MBM3424128.1 alpha/beta fold hydrolase [Bacteroidota bacterium]